MNIREAKQEIIHTVQAYLDKDETGAYTIPPERQRPILLMGPPGIGKTAIMEQVAQECGIGLVSYTITHHTRQSAIGLPFISKKTYGGREYSVTEYTMSEIIAAVYDQIEASGVKEGILFLDEINCVSETLAPTMLQFLQYKTFGTHRVPDGFLIVTAGNPPQYNKSVRDFDIVTLDRLRRIDIEEDFAAFKEYASRAGLHGSVMAYLAIRTPHFYSIRTEVEGRYFVTARGWEDLSRTIQVHEKNHLPVDERLVSQFLQDAGIARGFAAYYDLYQKYRDVYRVPAILAGKFYTDKGEYDRAVSGGELPERDSADALSGGDVLYLDPVRVQEIQDAPFDEKLSLISLLIDALGQAFSACALEKEVQELLLRELDLVRQTLKAAPAEEKTAAAAAVRSRCDAILAALRKKKDAGIPVPRRQEQIQRLACRAMEELEKQLREAGAGCHNPREQYDFIRRWFSAREEERQERDRRANDSLTNVFRFLSSVYGDGQEMVLFLTELSAGYYSMKFLNEHGNDAFFRYNRMLLLRDRRDALREEVLRLME
ncbi:MAG: AAA family ATPase [Eubacteriales bacterium]|nr:AAA family ATPase [Eubacteriales bacterium]